MSEVWSFWATAHGGIVSKPSRLQKSFISKNLDFEAQNDNDAKKKILANLKKFVRRLKTMRGRTLMVQAAPYIKRGEDEKKNLDGDRMIRLKTNFFHNKKILKVAKPDDALVQGYGPEALKKLGLD